MGDIPERSEWQKSGGQLLVLSGLSGADSSVKCFPTYVTRLPTGNEQGRFLALDLGGTNFRVLLVEIGDNRSFSMESKVFSIPKDIMTGSGDQLFDHIAKCLDEFVEENELEGESLPLGFTFSFPCKQEGLAKVRTCMKTSPPGWLQLQIWWLCLRDA